MIKVDNVIPFSNHKEMCSRKSIKILIRSYLDKIILKITKIICIFQKSK